MPAQKCGPATNSTMARIGKEEEPTDLLAGTDLARR
jgi:hypothetical protein